MVNVNTDLGSDIQNKIELQYRYWPEIIQFTIFISGSQIFFIEILIRKCKITLSIR